MVAAHIPIRMRELLEGSDTGDTAWEKVRKSGELIDG